MEKRPNHAGLDSQEIAELRRYTAVFKAGAGVLAIVLLLVFISEERPVRYLALLGFLAGAVLTALLTYVLIVGRRIK